VGKSDKKREGEWESNSSGETKSLGSGQLRGGVFKAKTDKKSLGSRGRKSSER